MLFACGSNVQEVQGKPNIFSRYLLPFNFPKTIMLLRQRYILLPKKRPPEDGPEKSREGVFTFGCHLDNGSYRV